VCGNGLVEGNEQCDTGEANGVSGCCAAGCRLAPAGTTCGPAGPTACDLPDVCDGAGASCPAGSGVGQGCTSDVEPAGDDPSAIDVTCEARTTGGTGLESSCDAAGFKAIALSRSAAAARAPSLCTLPTIPDVSATKDGPLVTRKLKKQRLTPGAGSAQTTLRLKLNKRGKKALKKDGCLTVAMRMVVRQGGAERIRRLITLRRR
jgi:hypothetical protein